MDAHGTIRRARKAISFSPAVILTSMLSCLSAAAHATLIDFDSLAQAPCTQESCDPTVVDNQYAALGVTFSGAGLYSYNAAPQIVTPPNAISDFYGPGMTIYFSGNLPTTAQMYVSSFFGNTVIVTAYDATGKIVRSINTDGWAGTEENSTPYRDQQLVAFSGTPISRIELMDFTDRRGVAIIDNLEFANTASVPLPAAMGLFASAIGCLIMRARAKK